MWEVCVTLQCSAGKALCGKWEGKVLHVGTGTRVAQQNGRYGTVGAIGRRYFAWDRTERRGEEAERIKTQILFAVD